MDTGYIREFIVLAETGNYHEAADRLFISQSALSKHIKALEQELGAELFERTGRGIVLGEIGAMFLPYARQTLQLETKYKKEIHSRVCEVDQGVMIGTEYRIMDLMKAFRRGHSEYFVRSIEGSGPGEVEKFLRMGRCELGVVCDSEEHSDEFIWIPYRQDELVVVLYDSHPLADREQLSFADLTAEEFIMMPEDTVHSALCRRLCEARGFYPNVVLNGSGAGDVYQMVSEQLGVSLMFRAAAAAEWADGLCFVPLEESIPTQIEICYRKNIKLSPAARAFLAFAAGAAMDSNA